VVLGVLVAAMCGLLAAPVSPKAFAATPPRPDSLLAPAFLDPPPPGSNRWNCQPSDEHPNPVVLVHGLISNQNDDWTYLSPILADQGYCVFSLTYGRDPIAPPPLSQIGGLGPMEDSARELARFIDRVREATGTDKVDIVGHSEGTLMPDYYVKFLGGDRYVNRYIALASLWRGTKLLELYQLDRLARFYGLGPVETVLFYPICASCRQLLHGSAFLQKMNSDGGPKVPGVIYTMIMTTHDEIVIPYTSGYLEGATNIVLQDHCPNDSSDHGGVDYDPVAAQYVLNALDPEHASSVRCTTGTGPFNTGTNAG
jgi:hypothetical protein